MPLADAAESFVRLLMALSSRAGGRETPRCNTIKVVALDPGGALVVFVAAFIFL